MGEPPPPDREREVCPGRQRCCSDGEVDAEHGPDVEVNLWPRLALLGVALSWASIFDGVCRGLVVVHCGLESRLALMPCAVDRSVVFKMPVGSRRMRPARPTRRGVGGLHEHHCLEIETFAPRCVIRQPGKLDQARRKSDHRNKCNLRSRTDSSLRYRSHASARCGER